MLEPVEGMKQAHGNLAHADRVGWAMGLHAGGLHVGDNEDELRLYLGGRLPLGDQMSGGLMSGGWNPGEWILQYRPCVTTWTALGWTALLHGSP